MKSLKLVSKAAIFVQTVGFMHIKNCAWKWGSQLWAHAITAGSLGEIKNRSNWIFLLTFLEWCVVLSPSLYMLIQLIVLQKMKTFFLVSAVNGFCCYINTANISVFLNIWKCTSTAALYLRPLNFEKYMLKFYHMSTDFKKTPGNWKIWKDRVFSNNMH